MWDGDADKLQNFEEFDRSAYFAWGCIDCIDCDVFDSQKVGDFSRPRTPMGKIVVREPHRQRALGAMGSSAISAVLQPHFTERAESDAQVRHREFARSELDFSDRRLAPPHQTSVNPGTL